MNKIVIAIVGLSIVGGGGYFLLRGTGLGDTAAPVSLKTPVDVTAPTPASGIPVNVTPTDPIPGAPAQTANATPTNQPKKFMQATLHTSKGDIVIEFNPELAPNAVANFVKLAQAGFYDGTKFHRVIKGFMNQGGDPLSKDDSITTRWGTGGPGYKFDDEITAKSIHTAGTIAMANSGKNTNGSQFFINAVDNHSLDGGYVVFGHVTSGMDVVTAINTVATNAPSNDIPKVPVIVKSISLK